MFNFLLEKEYALCIKKFDNYFLKKVFKYIQFIIILNKINYRKIKLSYCVHFPLN